MKSVIAARRGGIAIPSPGSFLKNPPRSLKSCLALLKSAGNRCKNCDALYNKRQSGKKATAPGPKQRVVAIAAEKRFHTAFNSY